MRFGALTLGIYRDALDDEVAYLLSLSGAVAGVRRR